MMLYDCDKAIDNNDDNEDQFTVIAFICELWALISNSYIKVKLQIGFIFNDLMYDITNTSQYGHGDLSIIQGTPMGLDMENHHLGYLNNSPIQVI